MSFDAEPTGFPEGTPPADVIRAFEDVAVEDLHQLLGSADPNSDRSKIYQKAFRDLLYLAHSQLRLSERSSGGVADFIKERMRKSQDNIRQQAANPDYAAANQAVGQVLRRCNESIKSIFPDDPQATSDSSRLSRNLSILEEALKPSNSEPGLTLEL